MNLEEISDKKNIQFRLPGKSDGLRVHQLIENSKPLDLNSPYLYFLLGHHFNETCVLAESGDFLAGALTAYRPPQNPEVLFIWQIAVEQSYRGRGLGRQMLLSLLSRDACRDVKYIELTVSPSNIASRSLFISLAKKLQAPLIEKSFLDKDHFGHFGHEEEKLLRIGPITKLNQNEEF